MSHRPICLAAAAALLVAGCGGGLPSPTPTRSASGKNVVVVTAERKLATSTPAGTATRPPPTPTFDLGFGSVLTPLAGTPTGAALALPRTPTPEVRPTRTAAPTFTPFPTIAVPRDGQPPAGPDQPPASGAPSRPIGTSTKPPTPTPVDPLERGGRTNDDLGSATPLRLDADAKGLLSSPEDVDVFRVQVGDDAGDGQIVVTLTGPDMDSYRLYLITPGRRSAAYGTPVGTVARHVVFPVRDETGTWYVEVSPQAGKRMPRAGYTVRVTTRSPADSGGAAA
jgi:hypothetical protein